MKAEKWEDTIIPEGDSRLIGRNHQEIQAQISFNEGYEQREREMNLQTTSLADMLLAQRKAGFTEGQADKGHNEAILRVANESRKAGMEEERAYWIKEIESQVHNAYEGGKEEERKKWIKGAMKVGILIAKPKEQAGIAEEFRLQGRREAVEWIEQNCLGCKSNTPSNTDEYLGFHKEGWLAFKKGLGIE